jgi:ribosomal protein L24
MFQIGDKVRVMSGDHKGQKGTIIGTKKGGDSQKGAAVQEPHFIVELQNKKKFSIHGEFLITDN